MVIELVNGHVLVSSPSVPFSRSGRLGTSQSYDYYQPHLKVVGCPQLVFAMIMINLRAKFEFSVFTHHEHSEKRCRKFVGLGLVGVTPGVENSAIQLHA